MTSSLIDADLGMRTPAWRTGPRSERSRGDDAVDLAAVADLVLDPWQQDVLRNALAVRPDGKWAAFEVGLVVPRQNGKGAVLEALELHALYRERDCKLILHSAHEFKTAKEAFRRVVGLIRENPLLSSRATIRYTVGEECVELDDGSRLRFVARSSGSGRGFSGDLVILDEAYNLSTDMLSAMLPTMSARPNPQLWYTSSAPLAKPESNVLRRLCKRGRSGESGRLAYMEWCVAEGGRNDDPELWAAANPGLGYRIDPEFIENELVAMESDDFARERLGLWVDLEDLAGWLVIPKKSWADCSDGGSKLSSRGVFALDVPPDRAWGSIGVAGPSGHGGTHVELVDRRPGTAWLAERAAEVQSRWGGKVAIAKGSPAWSLKDELEQAKVDLLPISTEEHAQACGDFYDAVMERQIRHIEQDELTAAVAGADRRYYGDAWLWSRRTSSVDISPLVAVTLAHWVAQKRPRKPKIL